MKVSSSSDDSSTQTVPVGRRTARIAADSFYGQNWKLCVGPRSGRDYFDRAKGVLKFLTANNNDDDHRIVDQANDIYKNSAKKNERVSW
eukprot:scaffold8482_cov55-Attheya_sp.AAC.3